MQTWAGNCMKFENKGRFAQPLAIFGSSPSGHETIRHARKNGHSNVLPHLQHALRVFLHTSQYVDVTVKCSKISLCQALGWMTLVLVLVTW